jgi:uncharacterized protein YbgA (DUF1722 family)/uncharacterized protein YbbK (DUF523 family)
MREFEAPVVVISKCLGFAACRWNGLVLADRFVDSLRPYVTFLPVCPEVEVGLGVPRHPVRVVLAGGQARLVQPATGEDATEAMGRFTASFLDQLGAVDGFLLKSRSPSCGIKDVRGYPGAGKVAPTWKGAGLFGAEVERRFRDLAVEDEGRLNSFRLREHFLTKLFTLARWRRLKAAPSARALIDFHADHKLLLMGYSQKELAELGRIVAHQAERPLVETLADYERHLLAALARPIRLSAAINVLMHALGYFSAGLSAAEKSLFLDYLEAYRSDRVPMSVPVGILQAWIARFEEPYLRRQVFFEPYPSVLTEITDSGKGRDL